MSLSLRITPPKHHIDTVSRHATCLAAPDNHPARTWQQARHGRSGLSLIVASLIVACVGAALEITLGLAYIVAQGLGWNWSEDPHPRREARFCCAYTLVLICAGLVVLCGPDPLKLTNFAMATAATLPVAIVPFLFVMNEPRYVKTHGNGDAQQHGGAPHHRARVRARAGLDSARAHRRKLGWTSHATCSTKRSATAAA